MLQSSSSHRKPPFAIYFPQFYPTTTNDKAWGHGFTDWMLVANANMRQQWIQRAPLRGFYDGASPDVHQAQITEALSAGIGGFGVYHYWFFTHQELAAFERTLLNNANAKVPWFLIWASEGWSRRWMADPTELVHLSNSPKLSDIQRHCDYLAHCFASSNYFHIDGRPLFVIYNIGHFSRPHGLLEIYRHELDIRGFKPYIVQFVRKIFDSEYTNIVDGSYLFEPRLFFSFKKGASGARSKYARDMMARAFGERFISKLLVLMDRATATGQTYTTEDFLSYLNSEKRSAFRASLTGEIQEVISPGWNNAPRYGTRYTAMQNLDPSDFSRLVWSATGASRLPPLVNAWNEWSEGAAVEPCAYLGRRYLDAIIPGADISVEVNES
jgi:hypothetical protein